MIKYFYDKDILCLTNQLMLDLQQQKLADLWESQMSTNNALQSVTFHFSKFHYYYIHDIHNNYLKYLLQV